MTGDLLINGGAYVTPGFIDAHTHYDPTVWWDPLVDPVPQHGVTTIVTGNCSLSLTPVRAADRVGASDAGAHLQMMCGAGDTTLLLTRHVRDRDDLTIETAVHELSGRIATACGIRGRGVLRPGAAGDVTVFALDQLAYQPDHFVHDLPGGAPRLTRPAGGFRLTAAAGVVTQEGGTATGARPAGPRAR